MKSRLILLIFVLQCLCTQASHVLGGQLFYEHVSGTTYNITLTLYRDCASGTALNASQAIYACATNGPANDVNSTVNRTSQTTLSSSYFLNPCVSPPSGGACIEEHIYTGTINLPNGTGGYLLSFSLCCRSNSIDNITNPGDQEVIYYCFVPDANDIAVGTENNLARFTTAPPTNICINDSIGYDHSAIDPDGDSLSYELFNPKGTTVDENCPPLPNTPFAAPYSANYPIPSSNPAFSINPGSGLLSGRGNQAGWYVYSVRFTEFRNGVAIAYGVRDFVFQLTPCSSVTPVANFDPQDPNDANAGYCSDLQVNFTNNSTNSAGFFWDFGDSTISSDTSTLASPTYTYTRPGSYTVVLIANPGLDCADTISLNYDVFPGVNAAFVPPDTACFRDHLLNFQPDTFNLTDSVRWDFGSRALNRYAYEFNPDSVQFDTSGNHTVCLIMFNNTCADTICQDIFLRPSPEINMNLPGPSCIVNNSLDFSASGDFSDAPILSWDFGPNANPSTGSGTNVNNISFNDIGWHTISLNIDHPWCDTVLIDSVLITDTIQAFFADPGKQCINANAFTFTAGSRFDSTASFLWTFQNASSNSSTDQNPSGINFTSVGSHSVSLTISQNGCNSTFTRLIDITAEPEADFDSIPNTCISNNLINFNQSGSYSNEASFLWNFGPNASPSSSTDENPTVSFDSLGTYTVSLSIFDNGCTDSKSQSFEITNIPVSNFPILNDTCISKGPFQFINSGTYGPEATFLWDFGINASPNTSNSESPSGISFLNPGSQSICLTISENGCDSTICKDILIIDNPTASITAQDPQCISVNSFDFQNNGSYSASASFNWSFENAIPSSSTDENPSNIIFQNIGYQQVQLVVLDAGCADTLLDSVYITAEPLANFLAPANQCLNGNSFDFQADGQFESLATFQWDFGSAANPNNSNNQNPTSINFSQTGYQPITLTINQAGCVSSYTDSIFIEFSPSASFNTLSPQCFTVHSFDFNNTGNYNSGASFNWNFGPSASPSSSNLENPQGIVFSSPGLKTISLTITDGNCDATVAQQIDVVAEPSIFIVQPANQCITGNSFNFISGGSFSPSVIYSWTLDSSASVQTSSSQHIFGVNYSSIGTKTVILSINDRGCISSDTIQFQVTDIPQPSFANFPDQCLSNGPFDFIAHGTFGPDATFLWDFDQNANPNQDTARNPQGVSWNSIGSYDICLTITENGCSNTYCQQVTFTPPAIVSFDPLASLCLSNNSYDLNNTSVYGATANFQWTFENANPASSNDEHPNQVVFLDTGYQTITLFISENGCSGKYEDSVYIAPDPQSLFVPGAAQCISTNNFSFQLANTYSENASYNWDFGANANIPSSTDSSVQSVVFNSVGYHPITLTVNDYSCTDQYTDSIQVLPVPNPSYSRPADQCLSSQNFTFIAEGTFSENAQFTWDFGSNSNPPNSNLDSISSVQFPSSGYHPVYLTVHDQGCDISYLDSVFVFDPPLANVAQPASQCLNGNLFNLQGISNDNGSATYQWIFDPTANISQSTSKDVNGLSYSTSGLHPIQFIASEAGCADTFQFDIFISDSPIADFDSLPGQCISTNNFDFTFSGFADSTSSFLWDFGANANQSSSSLINPTGIIYNTEGWQQVILQVNTSNCSDTYTDSVYVSPAPFARVDSMNEQCVSNNSFNWTQSSTTGNNAIYSWDFGPNASPQFSSSSNPQGISFNSVGFHWVYLSLTENSCSHTDSVQVYIAPEPVASFSNNGPFCIEDGNITFNFDGLAGNNANYNWGFGSNASPQNSTDQNPTGIQFLSAGTHTINLSVEENGCLDLFSTTVDVYDLPTVDFMVLDQSGCLPLEVGFVNLSFGDGDFSYIWDFGDGDSSLAINPSHIYQQAGWYSVSLILNNTEGCIGSFDTVYQQLIYVEDYPLSNFSLDKELIYLYEPLLIISNQSFGADSIFYTINGEVIPSNNGNANYQFTEEGYFDLWQYCLSSQGCLDSSYQRVKVMSEFQFYSPNTFTPNRDGMNDEFLQKGIGIYSYQLRIYDRWGKLIYSTTDIEKGWNGDTFEGGKASDGTYVYHTIVSNFKEEEFEFHGQVNLLR